MIYDTHHAPVDMRLCYWRDCPRTAEHWIQYGPDIGNFAIACPDHVYAYIHIYETCLVTPLPKEGLCPTHSNSNHQPQPLPSCR
jgi:hypothetical protein